MSYARYRYRNASPFERFKMVIRYELQIHLRDFLEAVLEMIAGFIWIFGVLFVLAFFAAISC